MIEHLEAEFPVVALCQTLDVSRSAFYEWQCGDPGPRQLSDNQLRPAIRAIFQQHKRRYGARRIANELHRQGQPVSPRRVARLMQSLQLKAIQPVSFKPQTTDSRHALGYSPNLLITAPAPTTINQVWVTDITQIPVKSGKLQYLALVMDLFSRRIVAWELQPHMEELLVLGALKKSIQGRRPGPGLIHHSDRGGQYAGGEYRAVIARARMLQSMSRAANVYDNAFMESCFGTIKTELELDVYENALIARKEISEYIRYYNTRRRHSSLGYLTPEEFEAASPRRMRRKPAERIRKSRQKIDA